MSRYISIKSNILIMYYELFYLLLILVKLEGAVTNPLLQLDIQHESSVSELEVSESDIKIFFYCQQNPVKATLVNIADPENLKLTSFFRLKDIYFYIHGFQEEPLLDDSTSQKVKRSVLSQFDVNFFLVDWSTHAKVILQLEYLKVVGKLEIIGNILGKRIKDFVENNGLDFGRIQLVGHSLGGQLAGIVGKVAGGYCHQVVGLDPAGPGFYPFVSKSRLSPESGRQVQAIHTNGGLLGYMPPLAHSDWYPNGGTEQPMCLSQPFKLLKDRINFSDVYKCSHSIAVDLYLESLGSKNFKGRNCVSYEHFKEGKCKEGTESWMGGYDLDTYGTGIFYVETNLRPPYAKG